MWLPQSPLYYHTVSFRNHYLRCRIKLHTDFYREGRIIKPITLIYLPMITRIKWNKTKLIALINQALPISDVMILKKENTWCIWNIQRRFCNNNSRNKKTELSKVNASTIGQWWMSWNDTTATAWQIAKIIALAAKTNWYVRSCVICKSP